MILAKISVSALNLEIYTKGLRKSTMADFFYENLQKKDSERCMFIV